MNFEVVIQNLSTLNDIKRVASAYVVDYRSLNREELIGSLIKAKKQYFDLDNIRNAYDQMIFHDNRDFRVISPIIIKEILLNHDGFMTECKTLNEEINKYQQYIINKAAEFAISKNQHNKNELEMMKFVLESAWENDDQISRDEKKLLYKIKNRLGITEEEYRIIQAQLSIYPQKKNIFHSNDQINEVKKELQRMGLLFQVRNDDGIDCDIIPHEVANSFRQIFGIEIKKSGYLKLIDDKRLRLKSYLESIIEKSGLNYPKKMQVKDMKSFIVENIKPTNLLGGYSTRDGLNISDLIDWSKDLGLTVNKTKDQLIAQIIDYFDHYREITVDSEDPRARYFEFYELLAARKLEELRLKGIIQKDLDCERLFEKATHYIFETLLNVQPIQQIKGNEHPDGILAFNDKLIMWDNKSKETDVNLKDHIVQFDRYIKTSEKPVAVFMVIGPSFTDGSVQEQTQYQLTSDTIISLITAEQLKEMAIKWNKIRGKEPFPLGYFKQSGRFLTSIVNY